MAEQKAATHQHRVDMIEILTLCNGGSIFLHVGNDVVLELTAAQDIGRVAYNMHTRRVAQRRRTVAAKSDIRPLEGG